MADKELETTETRRSQFPCSEKPIISVKEARKILGKNYSEKLSDADLSRIIGTLHKLASSLIDNNSVPKNDVVAWNDEGSRAPHCLWLY